MLRIGPFVLLVAALTACSTTASTPSASEAVPSDREAASAEPTAEPTPEATPEPTPEPRSAADFILTSADVPTEFGQYTGLELVGPNSTTEVTPDTLPEQEGDELAAKAIENGFMSGYTAGFGYGSTNLYSAAYLFDSPAGALAYQADDVAGFIADAGCTEVTGPTIGDASTALSCPAFGPVAQTAWIVFVTDNVVITVRNKAMIGESEPNLDLLTEIASNLEARVTS
jgi:hypothetical protein